MGNENKGGKKRFACLTNEQQELYNSWSDKQKAYVLYRAKGLSVADAYGKAGYKTANAWVAANTLETKTCIGMRDIIQTLISGKRKQDELVEGSDASKKLDEKLVLDAPPEVGMFQVPSNSAYVMDTKPLDVDSLSYDQAKNIQFYRQIANGTIKSVKVVKVYDKEGQLKEKRVEETSDLDTRIKAQKEVMRLTGTVDVLEIGQVKAQDINIMIVDASRRKDMVDERDKDVNKTKEDVVYVEEEVKENGQ